MSFSDLVLARLITGGPEVVYVNNVDKMGWVGESLMN